MCGRFMLVATEQDVINTFDVNEISGEGDLIPQQQIYPTQASAVITQQSPKMVQFYHWGLWAQWVTNKTMAAKLINARSETLTEKPAFKPLITQNRCLVLTNGYYEWQLNEAKQKTPYFITLNQTAPFAFAGLFTTCQQPHQLMPLHSFTIITTQAVPAIAHLHQRMPVILTPKNYHSWLSSEISATQALQLLSAPYQLAEKIIFQPAAQFMATKPKTSSSSSLQGNLFED